MVLCRNDFADIFVDILVIVLMSDDRQRNNFLTMPPSENFLTKGTSHQSR